MEYLNLCVLCVICYFGLCFGGKNIPPKILGLNDGHETVISSNTNRNFTCEGKKPVIWTYPNMSIEDQYFSKMEVKISHLPNKTYPYLALLMIQNASYVDTGFYYCHELEAEMNETGRSAQMYLYVSDPVHLAVDCQGFVTAAEYSEAVIGCRPTSPDVQVTLSDFNGAQVNYKNYDPKVGFTIFVSSLLLTGNYLCEFKLNVSEDEILIHLKVTSTPDSIEKPFIDVPNNGKTSVGETIVLNCTIGMDNDIFFDITWEAPDKTILPTNRRNYTKVDFNRHLKHSIGWSALTVKNATLKDAGNYTCRVMDHVMNTNYATKEIMVLNANESHINLSVVTDLVQIKGDGLSNVTWSITIDAYPQVNVMWINNKGEKIPMDYPPKYKTQNSQNNAILIILNVTLDDSGVYQLEVMNKFEKKVLNLTVVVKDKPRVTINTDKYHILDGTSELECVAKGNPLPEVKWFIQPCEKKDCNWEYIDKNDTIITKREYYTIATVNVLASHTGFIKCVAENNLGNDSLIKDFLVTDVENGFDVWGVDEPSAIASGENVTLNCGGSVYNFTDSIKWYVWRNNTRQPIPRNKRTSVSTSKNKYSYVTSLQINSAQINDSGTYVCSALQRNNVLVYLNETIVIKKPLIPKIYETNLDNTDKQIKAGAPVTLNCSAEGIPHPEIIWRKNGVALTIYPNNSHIKLKENNTILSFTYLVDDDSGEYSCNAVNKMGQDSAKIRLILSNSNWGKSLVIVLVVLGVVFVLLCTVLIVKIRKEKKLRRELKIAGLQNFEKGALESLNPDLGVDDQAELLPYDKKWEFPRDKLKLGKQLGSGAFGVVMKADAYGLCESENVTTVAVKMVKRNADYTYIKALASELKIMVHLGKHLNVVNLLGACTKNVAKRELLVIVEYCRYGNLHNYLLRHRDDFINQIDPKTGTIDTSIGAEYLNRTMSIGSQQSGSTPPAFAGVDYRSTPLTNSCNTESTVVCSPSGEDTMILSNNSAQPEWRSNYRGDYKGNVKPISTHDLLCWAFQVARGMEYLASRKVLHGDLAARNILLAEDNIVKICDFGLAKSMYKSDNYKKKGEGPLPVKWMAVESIRDRVFSTQSDVWSYGIVLWEFFSLARTPYPGMDADERLYNKLIEGYRMDKPEYATKDIYQIIQECWDAKPVYRPSFNKLAESLGSMLQETVKQHYISLNDPYIIMNNTQMEGHSDYLAMLSPPDYGNLASPGHEYVNGLQVPQDPEASTSGYLPMDIFSPKPQSNIFDFDTKKPKSHEEGSGTELLPILHSNVDSDSELSNPASPTKNFANPGYNTLPAVEDTNKAMEPKKDILPTSDNYINMPQQKKNLTDAFSNPNYIDIKKENNYVNSQSRDWERC